VRLPTANCCCPTRQPSLTLAPCLHLASCILTCILHDTRHTHTHSSIHSFTHSSASYSESMFRIQGLGCIISDYSCTVSNRSELNRIEIDQRSLKCLYCYTSIQNTSVHVSLQQATRCSVDQIGATQCCCVDVARSRSSYP
jgi:hypothetical protein